jgi:hypothetical protein
LLPWPRVNWDLDALAAEAGSVEKDELCAYWMAAAEITAGEEACLSYGYLTPDLVRSGDVIWSASRAPLSIQLSRLLTETFQSAPTRCSCQSRVMYVKPKYTQQLSRNNSKQFTNKRKNATIATMIATNATTNCKTPQSQALLQYGFILPDDPPQLSHMDEPGFAHDMKAGHTHSAPPRPFAGEGWFSARRLADVGFGDSARIPHCCLCGALAAWQATYG